MLDATGAGVLRRDAQAEDRDAKTTRASVSARLMAPKDSAGKSRRLGAVNGCLLSDGYHTATRLTRASAMAVSFRSVAFSSASVSSSKLAQSLRPSCRAHAARVP